MPRSGCPGTVAPRDLKYQPASYLLVLKLLLSEEGPSHVTVLYGFTQNVRHLDTESGRVQEHMCPSLVPQSNAEHAQHGGLSANSSHNSFNSTFLRTVGRII